MSIKKLPGLTLDGQLYKNEEINSIEAAIPHGGYKSAHAPTLLELENGDLLCAWFAGSFEGSSDISIVCARLKSGESNWDEPVKVSYDDERSEQNPSLFQGPDGAIWLMYTAQLDRQKDKDNMQFTSIIRRQKSFDNGQTWEEAETIFPTEGSFCRQPIQVLENGRFIFGNWICSDSELGLTLDPTVFQLSDDQGQTWRSVEVPNSNGRVHANVVELEKGHLVAFFRSRFADNVYRSESKDWGETWTEPLPTTLPNNNSSISVIKLQSGRLAIAYNPTSTPEPKEGLASWPGLRCPVAVALSEDSGETWPMIRWMERGEGFTGEENQTNNKQYEYPYLMQSSDGKLHLTYAYKDRLTVKYMQFSEEDVMGSKREKVGLYNPTSGEKS